MVIPLEVLSVIFLVFLNHNMMVMGEDLVTCHHCKAQLGVKELMAVYVVMY